MKQLNTIIKIIRKIVLSIMILHLIVNVQAQEVNKNISKDELIKKVWKAMFGELENKDIKSIYLEAYNHGREVPNKTTIKRPNLYRNEAHDGVVVFDGKHAAWAERTNDKEGNPRVPEMIDSISLRHFEIEIGIYFPGFFDYPSEFRGIKKVNGLDTYELFVEFPIGGYMSYFIDAKNFLINTLIVNWEGNPEHVPSEYLLSDYKDYKGILYPLGFTWEGNEGVERYQNIFKNVKFNVNPTNELFEIPYTLNKQ